MINAVIFDLDGVIRHFDPDNVAAIEARHGVDPGLIHASAFSPPLLEKVTTGHMRRSQWVEVVGQLINSVPAAEEWGCQIPHIDHGLLALVDDLRSRGYVAAVLTNGTDTILEELRVLGLDKHFNTVFNSAAIGYAKPDARAFTHVLHALALDGDEVFFADDSAANVAGAKQLGMIAHHYRGIQGLRHALVSAGVDDEGQLRSDSPPPLR